MVNSLNSANTTMGTDLIKMNLDNSQVKNLDEYSQVKGDDAKLKKASQDFEAVFVTKMFEEMDATIDRSGGIFGEENDSSNGQSVFRSLFYQEIGKEISTNKYHSFGFGEQIYSQMSDLKGDKKG